MDISYIKEKFSPYIFYIGDYPFQLKLILFDFDLIDGDLKNSLLKNKIYTPFPLYSSSILN